MLEQDPQDYIEANKKRSELPPIVSETIAPFQPSSKIPLPCFPDNRIIYWELKCPKLQSLPAIPLSLDNDKRKTSQLAELEKALVPKPAKTINDNQKKVLKWLTEQSSAFINGLYGKLQIDLVNQNASVIEHNNILTLASGSNTCASLLDSSVQSNSAMFYIVPYIGGKDRAKMAECVTILNQSMNHVAQYPSVATDSGSDKHTIQHCLTCS